MFDGSVHTISDVRHVPDLRMSILSLGKFDDDGYEFSGGKGQLMVTKGETVVARGRLENGVYRLIGETMIGEATVVDAMSKSSTIWYRRLGYMSKQKLKVPLDEYLLLSLKSINLDFCGVSAYKVRSNVVLVVTLHYTFETPVVSLRGMENWISLIYDFFGKLRVFTKRIVNPGFDNNKKEYSLWVPTTHNGLLAKM